MVLITKTDNGNDDYHGYNDDTDHDEGDYDVMRAQDRSWYIAGGRSRGILVPSQQYLPGPP